MGLANIKIIKLNIDARDRGDEMIKSYLPPENNPNSTLTLPGNGTQSSPV